jgi:aspartyl-tRNA(Asn)/glutamyl-tRNA(Gln) amidotransferase subunit A
VRDVAVSYNAMAVKPSGYVPPAQVDIRGLRIGLPQNFFFDRLDLDVAAAVRKAVQSAAALGRASSKSPCPTWTRSTSSPARFYWSKLRPCTCRILHRRAEYGADVLALLDQGRLISGTDYVDAQRLRRIQIPRILEALVAGGLYFRPGDSDGRAENRQTTMEIGGVSDDVRLATTRVVRAINALGISGAWPCRADSRKAAFRWGCRSRSSTPRKEKLLRIGAAIEDATGLAGRKPPGF